MYRIWKHFKFAASHQLDGLPQDHQCSRLHGHNYTIELELASEVLDERGFVVDFGDLKPFKKWIDDTLDHRHLNDIFKENPTAENMAKALHKVAVDLQLGNVVAVRVQETDTSWAEYRTNVNQ